MLQARLTRLVLLKRLLGQAEQLELLELGLQEPQDSLVRLAQAVARQELREPQDKELQELQVYLVLTELQVLQDCAELPEAQARLETKVQLGLKVLLESAQAEQLEQLVNKGQSAHRVLLEVSALAELLD